MVLFGFEVVDFVDHAWNCICGDRHVGVVGVAIAVIRKNAQGEDSGDWYGEILEF